MSYNANNILLGAATVQIGNGVLVDLGYTKGPTTVSIDHTFVDTITDQDLGTVRKSRSLEEMIIKFTLVDLSLKNLLFFFESGPTPATLLMAGTSSNCGSNGGKLILTGVSPTCGVRQFTFNSCYVSKGFDYIMSREEETSIEVELKAMKDVSGKFGFVVDL